MTDNPSTHGGVDPADAPLDAADQAVLAEVATMLDDVDPMPDDLVERMRFALALDAMYDEVAEMTRTLDDAFAVRTDLADATRTETLTFSSESLTAMVTVAATGPGRVRLDGWVSPGGVRRIGLRMQGTDGEVRSDETGRFVVEELREGFIQLVFHPLEGEDGGLVVTPLFKV